MKKDTNFTKKILNSLAGKKAVSMPDIKALLTSKSPQPEAGKHSYAVTRSIKNLADSGLVERLEGGQDDYLRLTKEGRMKATSNKLDATSSLVNPAWDGKWRIILLDLPEARKAEREALRYLLKKAGFILLKNSVWISPHPFEYLFENLKRDFNLTTELIIIVTDKIDAITEDYLRKNSAPAQ